MIQVTLLDYNNLEPLNTMDSYRAMELLKDKWDKIYDSEGSDTHHKFYESTGDYFNISSTHTKDLKKCFITIVKHTLQEADITID